MTDRTDRRCATLLALAVACCALAGCEENFARSDSITPWSGDDIAANEAIQTINPWPRQAFDESQITQGSKAEDAMQIYRLPPPPPATAPSTTDAAPAAPAAGASPVTTSN